MRRRRVKITGVGPVTPAGIGREAFWRGIQEPVSRVRRYTELGEEFGPFVATCVDGFDLREYFPPALGHGRGLARHTEFALAGTMLALADAGISLDDVRSATTAIAIGASSMDFGAICRSIDSTFRRGVRGALHPLIYVVSPASIGGSIVDKLGLRGRSIALQSSCCAGIDAIGFATDVVARGEADIAICGGSEAPLHRHPMLELRAAGLTPRNAEDPEKQCRPFDLWRTTGVIGEGASVFILEPESSPRKALAWVDGYAFASDVSPTPLSGLADAAIEAIANAGLRSRDIDALDAWGPGHRQIDALEVVAMRRVFGELLKALPTASIKGAIGNPLGAAGAIQVASAVMALQIGVIPPTVNWEHPDPACNLSLSSESRALFPRNVLVNAHGLSGSNASVVLTRADRLYDAN